MKIIKEIFMSLLTFFGIIAVPSSGGILIGNYLTSTQINGYKTSELCMIFIIGLFSIFIVIYHYICESQSEKIAALIRDNNELLKTIKSSKCNKLKCGR